MVKTAQLGVYVAKLIMAGLIAGFALVQNSVEGAVASMIFSPLGIPMDAFVSSAMSGSFSAAAVHALLLLVSSLILIAVGLVVRFCDSWGRRKPVTDEMRKRVGDISVRNTVAFATLVGIISAVNSSKSIAKPLTGSPQNMVLESVGLAIAVSVTVPLVNGGAMMMDSMRDGHTTNYFEGEGTVRSVRLALLNIIGLVSGNLLARSFLRS